MTTLNISDETRKNFHLFWDNHPAAVILIDKNRTIIEILNAEQELVFDSTNKKLITDHANKFKSHQAYLLKTAFPLSHGRKIIFLPLSKQTEYGIEFFHRDP